MNFHKNDENNCTSRINKGGASKMNIFESLGQLMLGAEERWLKKFMDFKSRQRGAFYRRFTGKSKSQKRHNKR